MTDLKEEQNPIPYLEGILKECSDTIESYKESIDVTKIIWFTQRCIPRMETLEEWARNEDFIQCLKKYNMWTAVDRIFLAKYEYLVIEIDSIDWEKEVIRWHNKDDKYPNGSTAFSQFRHDFIPMRI